MVLLDTNVISELIKAEPNRAVVAFLENLDPETIFTAAICEAEIRFGLARLPAGHRRDNLAGRISMFVDTGFRDRILSFDRACAAVYGDIRHAREAVGKPIAVEDAMIAATARAFGARVLATRNVRDFVACGTPLIDPWTTA